MKRILRPSLRNLIGKKDLVGVEVGVYMGANSNDILGNLDIKKLYLVDPYFEESTIFTSVNYKSFIVKEYAQNRLKEYNDKIVWIDDVSENIFYYIDDDYFDFVYLDGDHTYEWVMKDLVRFYPKIKDGGLFGGHDFDEETKGNQVKKAVVDFFTPLKKDIYFDVDPYSESTHDWWVFK